MGGTLDILNLNDIIAIEIESKKIYYPILKKSTDITKFIRNIDSNEILNLLRNNNVNKEQYFNSEIFNTQHGLRHHLRVQLYSYFILKKLNYDNSKIEMMNYICAIHDTQRKNDFKDYEHGLRAYKKFVENNDYFNSNEKNIIKETLEQHDSKLEKTNNFYLMVLKCADALDRFRLKNPGGWINFDRIPNSDIEELMIIKEETKKMVSIAREFTIQTEKSKILNKAFDDYQIIEKEFNAIKEEKENE